MVAARVRGFSWKMMYKVRLEARPRGFLLETKALATIWTQEKSHELLEVRGQQDWPAMAAQILIRANSKKANSKVRTINSLIFPAASRGPSRYTPHPGFHTTYHSLYTSATKRHQTGPDDVDLGFVFKPYDLLALPAGTRDVLYRENPACEGSTGICLGISPCILLPALLWSDF